ncbi:unnamed protein product [Pedinophyceae sp. YPF-701]|nr:unnamed protein product [Pedinophyceae sp. YPF-701]
MQLSFAASVRTALPTRPRTSRRARSNGVQVRALFGGGKGGEGGNPMANMAGLLDSVKKAQQLVQQETAQVQAELAATEFEGYSEDETVRVVFSGNQEPKGIDITQAAYDQGPEKLEALIQEAMSEAHSKSVAGMRERMQALAQKLGLPNMGGGGGMGGMGGPGAPGL